jgi:uncharacterized integral membrane protein (TIGR02327 family)
MANFGFQSAMNLTIHLVALILTWWAMQNIKWEVFVRFPKSARTKVLMIFIAIAVSWLVAKFFIDYVTWSLNLPQIYNQ